MLPVRVPSKKGQVNKRARGIHSFDCNFHSKRDLVGAVNGNCSKPPKWSAAPIPFHWMTAVQNTHTRDNPNFGTNTVYNRA